MADHDNVAEPRDGDGDGEGDGDGDGVGAGDGDTVPVDDGGLLGWSPPPPQAASAKVRSVESERFLMAVVGALIAGTVTATEARGKGTCY